MCNSAFQPSSFLLCSFSDPSCSPFPYTSTHPTDQSGQPNPTQPKPNPPTSTPQPQPPTSAHPTQVHNINLVTPEHVVPQVVEALSHALDVGLSLPVIYNTGGYDSAASCWMGWWTSTCRTSRCGRRGALRSTSGAAGGAVWGGGMGGLRCGAFRVRVWVLCGSGV